MAKAYVFVERFSVKNDQCELRLLAGRYRLQLLQIHHEDGSDYGSERVLSESVEITVSNEGRFEPAVSFR